jgi:hypothetical protein
MERSYPLSFILINEFLLYIFYAFYIANALETFNVLSTPGVSRHPRRRGTIKGALCVSYKNITPLLMTNSH